MRNRLGYRTMTYISPLAIALAVGCGGVGPSTEGTGESTQASTAAGLTASISVNQGGSNYNATVTVTNSSAEPASNWQVGVNLNGATLQQGYNGAEAYNIAGVT